MTRELLDVAGEAPVSRVASRQPEMRLILAILEDAVRTFRQYVVLRQGTPRRFRQIELWLSSDDTEWAFSFVNICEALGFDVDRCRAGLERWRRRQEMGDGTEVPVASRPLPASGTGRRRRAAEAEQAADEHRALGPHLRVVRRLRVP